MKSKRSEYPYPTSRIYLSVAITVLSSILALQLLPTPDLILRYLASTAIIATIAFILKKRYFYTKTSATRQEVDNRDLEKGTRWKRLILLFSFIAIILVSPLLLAPSTHSPAKFIDTYTWLILIVSFTSGISISEISLYIYLR